MSDPDRVLVITAHPDDVDFGAGGTVAAWTGRGVEVSYCVVTDGDAGGFDPEVPRSEIGGIRREEQRAAGQELGVTDVTFLGYPDGRLYVSHELRRDVSRVVRQKRPQRVLIQSPERNWERIHASHPDHLAAGEAAMCAVYPDARNPFAHPDLQEEAWTVGEVWIMASGDPGATTFVDVTDTFERKVAALRAHTSQTAHMADLSDRMRAWARLAAEKAGLEEGRLAEGFRVVDTR